MFGDVHEADDLVQGKLARVEDRESLVTEFSLPCDPLLDPLESLPEFNALLAGVGMRVCPARTSR